ncbi:ABC transporter permease [bacterium]|nr:ABC transporter permease [bacterium]RQV94748.1 MAG: ABC transporter permease [bacterium]
MFKNYLKTAIRHLRKDRIFTAINIFGFAFSISVCLAIVSYLLHEYSYDRYHENGARIYRLIDSQENSSAIDYRVKQQIVDNFPEVENVCLYQLVPLSIQINRGERGYYIENILSTDNAFFEMFSVPFIHGNPEKPFDNLHSVVITESAARELFGDEDPMGKEIVYRKRFPLTVTGVIENFPNNSSMAANVLVNDENDAFKFSFSCADYRDVSSHRYPFRIYMQLNDQVDGQAFTAKLQKYGEVMFPYVNKADLLPLKDIYLHDPTRGSNTLRGNPGLLALLMGIAMIILTLAVINYINLSASQQGKRGKEIGVKKTIGASRSNLIIQFLAESVLISFMSFVIALIIFRLGMPFYNVLFGKAINYNILFQVFSISLIVLSVVLLGTISGIGTALVFSSIQPVSALKGDILKQGSRSIVKNGLSVFQFTISIVLIFCTIIIQKQIGFVKHNHPGFHEDHLLRIDLPGITDDDRNNALLMLDRFRQYPGITGVSLTNGIPGYINTRMGANMEGKQNSLSIIYADTAFMKTFGIELTQGRDLLPGEYGTVCMINEAAYRYFEWDDLDNKRYNNGRQGGFGVIGVVKDFHYQSLYSAIEPMAILFYSGSPTHITVRMSPQHVSDTMNYIQRVWQTILPAYPLKYQFYDEWFDQMYRNEEQFAGAISVFAILAIVISCIGILGLAITNAERRTKEIGIRKVLGASVSGILYLLSKDFAKWIIVANIFALPIGYFAVNHWLQDFAYHTGISWWTFLLAGLLALVIALLTVSWQVVRAATANPVKSLRYE